MCGSYFIRVISYDREGHRRIYSRIKKNPTIPRIGYLAAYGAIAYPLTSILHVSRTFSIEALQMIYKTSIFCFIEADTLRAFVDRVPERSLSLIGNIQIHLSVLYCLTDTEPLHLIRSCLLSSLPAPLHLNLVMSVRHICSPQPLREEFTIEEQLPSSPILPQLKCATLRLRVHGHSKGSETIEARARRDFDIIQRSLLGPVA